MFYIAGIFGRLVLCFSAYTNGKKILGTSQPKGSLTAVNGIRFLSMSWVILGHTLAFVLGSTCKLLLLFSYNVNFVVIPDCRVVVIAFVFVVVVLIVIDAV